MYLTVEQLEKIYLPKWPGCDVDGKPVSVEQAREILVRTGGTHFFSNDHQLESDIKSIFYSAIPHPEWGDRWWEKSEEDFREYYSRKEEYAMEMGVLGLEYLTNDRVCSSYVFGPNGWCNWDGVIHQRNKNIGKWPSAREVFNEWGEIAKAFPFLELTCRLLSHEAGYHKEEPKIAVVYEVANGEVKARMPQASDYGEGKISGRPDDSSFTLMFLNRTEQGVGLLTWEESCRQVAQRNNP